jgi:putative endonuclease
MEFKPSKFYVYILSNRHKNVVYIGSTRELRKRISCHKRKLIPGFTEKYNVDQLIHFEEFDSEKEALMREKQLKGYRREKKNLLIHKQNPNWADLYEALQN